MQAVVGVDQYMADENGTSRKVR